MRELTNLTKWDAFAKGVARNDCDLIKMVIMFEIKNYASSHLTYNRTLGDGPEGRLAGILLDESKKHILDMLDIILCDPKIEFKWEDMTNEILTKERIDNVVKAYREYKENKDK